MLCLIPARSGSKGLVGKNTRILCGKPLIGWSIDVAKQSKYIDEIVCSTDCENISSLAKTLGAEVPFLRPCELAEDTTPSSAVIRHALETLELKGLSFDILVLLEPTSPLRMVTDVDGVLEKLVGSDADSIVSVVEAEGFHPKFAFKYTKSRSLMPMLGEFPNSLRRQEVEEAVYCDGSIYCSYTQAFLKTGGFYHENTGGYKVKKWQAFEVDDAEDFIIIQAIIESRLFFNG